MADEEQKPLQPFPDPPPFFKHFTAENLKRLQDIGDSASDDVAPSNKDANAGSKLSTEQILALPTELRYLIPPHHLPTKSPSTSSAKQQRAPAPPNRQAYLNRFNRSLIIEYIKLLGIVAINPTSPGKNEVLKHILNLVCNMHGLINEYRPHQARETLIRIMEEQVARKKREIEGVKGMGEKVRGVLDGFGKAVEAGIGGEEGGEVGEVAREGVQSNKRKDRQRGMWDVLDEELGL
ncbi:Mediator of RNA polymerase II transcription subunit 7 [Didymella sp. IMI 355093]|nr:Mediator of RNA polymerase II transcription subunit 7 [Didymella sp. IMI 355093]